MAFPDIAPDLKSKLPQLRGRLLPNEPLAPLTWFRVGGPAQVLFMPEDENDLAYFLANLPSDFPVTVVGLGSNLIVRDGGVPGVVIRLGPRLLRHQGRGRAHPQPAPPCPTCRVARAAQKAALAGLAFLRGIPGADRWRAAHERRRLRARDQGCADRGARRRSRRQRPRLRQWRHALHLSPLRRARRHHLHRGAVPGHARRSRRHRRRDGQDHRERARPRSRSRAAPAARPSRTRPATRPGSSSMPPAAAGSSSATRRSRRCTAIS